MVGMKWIDRAAQEESPKATAAHKWAPIIRSTSSPCLSIAWPEKRLLINYSGVGIGGSRFDIIAFMEFGGADAGPLTTDSVQVHGKGCHRLVLHNGERLVFSGLHQGGDIDKDVVPAHHAGQ